MSSLRRELFRDYNQLHADFVDGDAKDTRQRMAYFIHLFEKNYQPLFADPNQRFLEIGCGKGYFMKVLVDRGFHHVSGIDLSEENIRACREQFHLEGAETADAEQFLQRHRARFDIIFLKDVLEHIPKDHLAPFLGAMERGLTEKGVLIIQVPNMDWLASQHERYMDMTHEIGFTRESLGQLLRLHFEDVEIRKVDGIVATTWKQKILYRWVRPLALLAHRIRMTLLSEGAKDFWFDCREIMAICRAPRPVARQPRNTRSRRRRNVAGR